ncbi:transcriptional regulator [Streptomyces cinnamoneus]|uniref:Transcriptional regulator n=1 Tax=Streptomyces cinnamoneus TaxID=53446 RepID=A0A2G1XEI9_STRCJ|nr:helix-turn-helix transcriptional regulator [Streptomyces cinnamoneus]PHQ49643.1 transcriptional regulator [Streptomyces cinnamoneus]PPT14635.1 XRE family transcriptional regulator [Streptomyces cinnamoneus]
MAKDLGAQGPSIARQAYGEELRLRREAANHTQQSLADTVVCSPSLIAHIEAGRRKPRVEDARRLDKELGTDGFFERFLPTLSPSRFAGHFAPLVEMEKQATSIREHGSGLVPGLLQIEPYARAIFRFGLVNMTAAEVDRRVAQRLERSHILEGPDGPVMWVLLDEHVLRRVVGGPAVMAAQLRHVAKLADSGRIRLHVLPFSIGSHALVASSMSLYRFDDAPPLAYVEGVKTGHMYDEPSRVAQCQAAYELALGDALSCHASLSMINAVAEEYEHAL